MIKAISSLEIALNLFMRFSQEDYHTEKVRVQRSGIDTIKYHT